MNKYSLNTDPKIEKENDEIDLRDIVYKYLKNWKWFALSIFICVLIGAFIYLKTERVYEISTSVLLKENKGSNAQKNSPLGTLEDLGLLSTTNNIDNEIAVFSSPNLMKQIVLDLELQTSYFVDRTFREIEIYKNSPYYVRLEDVKPDDLKGFIELHIKTTSNKGVTIEGKYAEKKSETSIEGSLDNIPGFINLPKGLGRLYVALRPNIPIEEDEYIVYINNAQRVAYEMAQEIKISPTTKTSSVLSIKMATLNVDKGIDILNEMVKIYNANNVNENNEMAQNTSLFIDERLKVISSELSDVEDEVVNYKKEQRVADLDTEAKVFVEQTSLIDQKKIELETQLKTVELVESFIQKSDNNYKLIPNLGIIDPGLAEVIASYNGSLLAYERLEKSASEDNPIRKRALSELSNTRESIQGAVNNVKRALNISKQELQKQSYQMSSRIYAVPTQERGLLEITRQQQIKQALYLYLMQVKEETNITMASTSDKAKVITDPIIPDHPISPKKSIIFLVSLILGLIIPAAYIYIKDMLQLNITSREELEKASNVNVIGEIMKNGEDNGLVVGKDKTTPIAELFRSLRNNLQFILDDPNKKVILVTSTVPGEGKTFISVNLAGSFALSDKKILLIGMDIRNPKLAVNMDINKGEGLTSYLSGSQHDWKSLVNKSKDFPNLDILQAGIVPPNPNELLMKPALKELMNEARKIYDIIIIDSAPVGVVSDTFLLKYHADTTVYVVRENVTPKNAITFINEVYANHKLPNMYLVLNDVELSKNKSKHGRYGYGYSYGYSAHK